MCEEIKSKLSHLFALDSEMADGVTYKVDAESILLDLKVLIRDYYMATFTLNEDALKMQFTNGQTFLLKIEEV